VWIPATASNGNIAIWGLGNDYAACAFFENRLAEAGLKPGPEFGASGGRTDMTLVLGQTAAHAMLPHQWPQANVIRSRRGYVWNTPAGHPVVATLHPKDCLLRMDPSGISRFMLLRDLERVKHLSLVGVKRPERTVTIVTKFSVKEVCEEIRAAGLVACDIECIGPQITQCIGFATTAHQAFVFPPEMFKQAFGLLRDPRLGKIWQNGQFDLYHLLTREGLTVAGEFHDCIVAWHCMWPEIAGKSEDKRNKSKRTAKSLAFFGSVYTLDKWWKNYEGATDEEMYILNGKDCCITYDVFMQMRQDMIDMGVEDIYEHERRLPRVCVALQQRGLRVDGVARLSAIEALQERLSAKVERLQEVVEPLLVASLYY